MTAMEHSPFTCKAQSDMQAEADEESERSGHICTSFDMKKRLLSFVLGAGTPVSTVYEGKCGNSIFKMRGESR